MGLGGAVNTKGMYSQYIKFGGKELKTSKKTKKQKTEPNQRTLIVSPPDVTLFQLGCIGFQYFFSVFQQAYLKMRNFSYG